MHVLTWQQHITWDLDAWWVSLDATCTFIEPSPPCLISVRSNRYTAVRPRLHIFVLPRRSNIPNLPKPRWYSLHFSTCTVYGTCISSRRGVGVAGWAWISDLLRKLHDITWWHLICTCIAKMQQVTKCGDDYPCKFRLLFLSGILCWRGSPMISPPIYSATCNRVLLNRRSRISDCLILNEIRVRRSTLSAFGSPWTSMKFKLSWSERVLVLAIVELIKIIERAISWCITWDQCRRTYAVLCVRTY